MKTKFLSAFIMLLVTGMAHLYAQTDDPPPVKNYPQPEKAGDAAVAAITHDMVNGYACVIWSLDVPATGQYVVQSLGNFGSTKVYITSSPHGEPATDLDPGRARIPWKLLKTAGKLRRPLQLMAARV